MTSDAGSRQAEVPRPDFELPDVLEVRTRRIGIEPPIHRHFESALTQYHEAVEFVVVTDRPIPVRALGPTLFVGEQAITEVSAVEPNVYRFLALEPDRLEAGAPIALAWAGLAPAETRHSRFVYKG